jgi:hypothetical protein
MRNTKIPLASLFNLKGFNFRPSFRATPNSSELIISEGDDWSIQAAFSQHFRSSLGIMRRFNRTVPPSTFDATRKQRGCGSSPSLPVAVVVGTVASVVEVAKAAVGVTICI